MRINIRAFSGEQPRVEDRYLPDTAASGSVNTQLNTGALSAYRAPLNVADVPLGSKTFIVWNGKYIGYPSLGVTAAQGPVTENRLYITIPGQAPLLRIGDVERTLAVPAPPFAPTVIVQGTPSEANSLLETIIYGYSNVTQQGEESAMSPLPVAVDWRVGQPVVISNFSTTEGSRAIAKRRIYRSQTGSTGVTDFYFVAEISASETDFTHNLDTNPIVEPAPNLDYDEPPIGLQGIIAMPNGMMAAFKGKEVFFCEPYRPHAWPRKYTLVVNDTIVGMAAFGTTLAILTTATPYIAQGLHPDNMAMTKIEQELPCVSGTGVVDLGYSAAYPSTDGLVLVSEGGAQLVSGQLFTKEQWQALNPSQFRASRMEGQYIFAHDTEGRAQLGLIDLRGDNPFYNTLDLAGDDIKYDVATGRTLMLNEDGSTIVLLDPPVGGFMTYEWTSKPFHMEYVAQFGAVRAHCHKNDEAEDLLIDVFADGTLIHTSKGGNKIHRLPPGIRSNEWSIRLRGSAVVTDVTLAGSPSELAGTL